MRTRGCVLVIVLLSTGAACGGGGGGESDATDGTDVPDDSVDSLDDGSDPDAGEEVVIPPSCGNDLIEPGEACDGTDLGGLECTTVAAGFVSGDLACMEDCSGFVTSGCTEGGTVAATSCSQGDVQDAIDDAVDGDTVLVPEGTCTWSTLVAGTPAVLVDGKGIVLRGAGVGLTVILDETGTTGDESLLVIEGEEGRPFRVTGFTIERRRAEDTDTYFISIGGTAKNWRVDHSRFAGAYFGSPDAAVTSSGDTYGLVDHDAFEGFSRVTVFGDYFSTNVYWKAPLRLGTVGAVYVEDCTFDSSFEGTTVFGNAIDSNGAGRWVVRHNTLNDRYFEAHGNTWGRGTFSYEIYENVILDGVETWVPVSVRGGTGVIFDNTFDGFVDGQLINIYNDRSAEVDGCNGMNPLDGNTVEDSGAHGGADGDAVLSAPGETWEADFWAGCAIMNETDASSAIVTANTADSITAALEGGTENDWDAGDAFSITCGYPCVDQIGRSTDASATEVHPQAFVPLCEWNNTSSTGDDFDIVPHGDFEFANLHHLIEDRDFMNDHDLSAEGYVPYVYPHPLASIGD